MLLLRSFLAFTSVRIAGFFARTRDRFLARRNRNRASWRGQFRRFLGFERAALVLGDFSFPVEVVLLNGGHLDESELQGSHGQNKTMQ